jgi:acetylornithine/succinyldiaminopimelate/putrescine aminotransferase
LPSKNLENFNRTGTKAYTQLSMFGYEMMLPMNTGAEGVESAIKMARRWGYEKKKIPKNKVFPLKTSSILKCHFAYCDLLELQSDPYEYNGS